MLHAISPIDGRYASKTQSLSQYFSEYALIRARVVVEIEYFIALCNMQLEPVGTLDDTHAENIRRIAANFSTVDAERIKEIEATTNHDVKAVEYFLKEQLEQLGLGTQKEWIHFALTSQDINNTATPLLLKHAIDGEILKILNQLLGSLQECATTWSGIPMLAHTHGQPASPTTVGKEFRVFIERLDTQRKKMKALDGFAKFGGATGNFNAHVVTFPEVDWQEFGDDFVALLGLRRIQTTTQIDHYDHIAEAMHVMVRISTICIDFCRDLWTYISLDYFKQKTIAGEVGSSTMPHKVNPIDFENAEGNLGIAIALFNHLAIKLPVSRMQRDLTDSTVLRNLGVPFAHVIIAFQAMLKGISKLELNEQKLHDDLDRNWIVIGEAIQTILRREGVSNPYELLKEFTRGKAGIGQAEIHTFIDQLELPEEVKKELKEITPFNYIGYT